MALQDKCENKMTYSKDKKCMKSVLHIAIMSFVPNSMI